MPLSWSKCDSPHWDRGRPARQAPKDPKSCVAMLEQLEGFVRASRS
jgi:hypothetical protein